MAGGGDPTICYSDTSSHGSGYTSNGNILIAGRTSHGAGLAGSFGAGAGAKMGCGGNDHPAPGFGSARFNGWHSGHGGVGNAGNGGCGIRNFGTNNNIILYNDISSARYASSNYYFNFGSIRQIASSNNCFK